MTPISYTSTGIACDRAGPGGDLDDAGRGGSVGSGACWPARTCRSVNEAGRLHGPREVVDAQVVYGHAMALWALNGFGGPP